jgi:sulfite exporter TauE/SafE
LTELWLSFLAGLAGSGHCLGMCGGIVAALSFANPGATAGQLFRMNLAYHAGRILTYSFLGLLAGAISQMALLSSLKPYFSWLFIAAHCLVISVGLATLLNVRRWNLATFDGSGWGFMHRILRTASGKATPHAFLIAGLIMGLLPCGLIYGVLISTATTGSWIKGGVMMLAFGAGTLPALLAYGQVASSISAVSNTLFMRIMGAVIALLGAVGLVKALQTIGILW